jgi:hypothetical protein
MLLGVTGAFAGSCLLEGGSRNYYLTPYFASALYLVTWATGHGANGRRWTRGPRSYSLLATLVAGLALSASFVVFPDRFGRISVADAAQLGAAEVAARAIGASAKPVFVEPSTGCSMRMRGHGASWYRSRNGWHGVGTPRHSCSLAVGPASSKQQGMSARARPGR